MPEGSPPGCGDRQPANWREPCCTLYFPIYTGINPWHSGESGALT